MTLEIKEVNNKEVWEGFLANCGEKTFLHSWDWGEFQKKMGCKIWRLGIYENGELIAVSLVIKVKARRGTFIFVPHGPNIKITNSQFPIFNEISNVKFQILKILLEKFKKIANGEKIDFIRIAPIWERTEENIKIFKDLGLKEAPIHIHPELTWELDITPSEEELLMGMRKTTRYLIRQAEKNQDIGVTQSQNIEDIKVFDRIYQKTAHRHKFLPFSLEYLEKEFLAFKEDNQVSMFLGKYKNQVVSSAIVIYWQNCGFYHQGASLSEYNKIPVSYLLQWEAIREAKKRGCKIYNFWGIADKTSNLKHPWAGLTLFKMGFGGYKKEYVKTQDFPLSKKYFLTYIFEKIRKIKRRL